jgi:hypothetical protein
MSAARKDRVLLGAGAGRAPRRAPSVARDPLPAFLGIAGAAATIGTFVLAGAAFAVVVGLATLVVVLQRRRAQRMAACDPQPGPVDIILGSKPKDEARS